MSQDHTGNLQPAIDREEHDEAAPASKAVLAYGVNGSTKTRIAVDTDGKIIATLS